MVNVVKKGISKEELQEYCTEKLVQNEDGSFSTKGDVNLSNKNLTKLPKFKEVEGSFDCSDNQLTTLAGSPQEVGGSFYCNGNQLTTLVGSPQKVGGGFYCSSNQLTTLVGSPQEVRGSFDCNGNLITKEKLLATRKSKSI